MKLEKILKFEIILAFITIFIFFLLLEIALYGIVELKTYTIPIILLVVDFIIFVSGISFCIYIEQQVGYYRCKECGEKYKPRYSQVFFAMHMGRTRYMRCPKCNKKSWNKKVIE